MKVFAGLSVAALLVANSPLALAAPTGLNTRNELSDVHGHTEPIGLQGPTHHHRRDLLGGLLGGLIPGAGLLGGLLPGAAPAQPAAGAAPTTPAAGGDGGLLGGLFGLVTNGPLAGITDSLKNTLVDTFL
ncbi:hypothetical protein TWF106_000245 [Orbilia oligospora]|uniref:Uncharacterized protein n=1 Tax=Orbilia oligospora TaxID=2813651 RepID=A0A6G1M2G1_ORBOL|nr:hypothetical protein TWF788_010883 [Orbilia oligospora]KAF3217728.1 hypothetical protein TWF679_001929 [Orbilia oligospora]KAF3226503.1 hypothetical protein TWF106_000245 [Orbilia oligospora]KAF3232348.1 hypothetical protein TWF191_000119 [Orbilia oligospora]KAF3242992.1 hypothetical protein TWF192_008460 [Orbilia oligospora]